MLFETTVILINFNSHHDTVECLESLIASETKPPYVVIVDNNSSNQKILRETFEFYPHLNLIFTNENIGFGRANNLAVDWIAENLQTKYIFLLNNDTVMTKDAITLLRSELESSSEDTVMSAPKILIFSNKDEVWYGGGEINYLKVTPEIKNYSTVTQTEFASGCAMFFKADYLLNIGGFDPFFFMYDEDVELCIRINRSGKSIVYVPSSVILHKCQGSQPSAGATLPSNQLSPHHPGLMFYLKNTILNRKYIIQRHFNGRERRKAIVYQITYWTMKCLQYLLNGKITPAYVVLRLVFRFSFKK